MATAAGYVPNIHHPDVMRSILEQIVDTGDAIGSPGPGRTTLAITVDNWLIDELAALGSDLADREAEYADHEHPWVCARSARNHTGTKRRRRCLSWPAVGRKRQLACCCGLGRRVLAA